MKKVFIDSDVILDVLAHRERFYHKSAQILSLCENGRLEGSTTPLVFSNIFYLLSKLRSKEIARTCLRKLRLILEIMPLNSKHVDRALNSGFSDFEDALQNYSSEDCEMEVIITRNISDYKLSNLPVHTPSSFLNLYNKK